LAPGTNPRAGWWRVETGRPGLHEAKPRANRDGGDEGTLRDRRRRKATSLLRVGRVSHIPPADALSEEPNLLFKDRVDAGKKLATALEKYRDEDIVVLGIPRGGVVVANEVAKALGARLDVVVTRKIGAPGEPEYALGAVTQEGDVIMDRHSAESLGATPQYLGDQVRKKREEVKERMERFRGDAPYPELRGKLVVIVDDGIATGSSVEAAVMSVKRRNPSDVVVAVPVAPREAVEALREHGTKVICLETPRVFFAIGEFYGDFGQVEDLEVRRILDENSRDRE
jgi:putative phosphoribosyl transferase